MTVSKDPFLMRVHIVGDEIMFSPDGVPALEEAENRVGVGVVSTRSSIAEDHAFQGGDMVPAALLFNELGIRQLTAKIIEARDEMPFLCGVGGPSMAGRVVLDEFSDIIGQHLPIVGFGLGPTQEKIMFFGPSDDGRHGDLLSILLPEQIRDVAIVIGVKGDIRVFNQSLLPLEFVEDVFFWSLD